MEKKNWFVRHKILTGILVIVFISIIKGSADAGKADRINNQNQINQEMGYVFDIPSLVGKNVDEIISLLGQPKEGSLPTEEQTKLSNEWSIEFGKDGQTLLVEYNLKTKVVKDLFISGDNKVELLKIGNLKENDPNYSLEFIKQQNDSTKITGVTITEK